MKKTKNITIKPKTLRLKSSVQEPTIKIVDFSKIFDTHPYAKFLREQNLIALLLSLIIKSKTSFRDENLKAWFEDWLEQRTLGELIEIFKKGVTKSLKGKKFKFGIQAIGYKIKEYTIEELAKLLTEYNQKRNDIVHRLFRQKFTSEEEIVNLAEKTNQKGEIILTILEEIWKEEIDKQLQEAKEKIMQAQKLIREDEK